MIGADKEEHLAVFHVNRPQAGAILIQTTLETTMMETVMVWCR